MIVLVLCVGVAVWHSRAEKQRARMEIQKRLDAIRAVGEPVTADDLAKLFPDPPPERDAALLLAPAVAAFRDPDSSNDVPFVGSGELPPRTHPLTQQMRTAIEAILDDNQTALNAIPWDKLTNAWIGPGFALGFTNMTEYRVHPVVVLGKMLCLKAIVEAESGNGRKASESLLHSLALFHIFRSGVFVHHLVRRTGEELCCETLERVMNRAEIPPNDLAAVEHLLSDDHPEGFRESFMVIRCRNIYGMTLVRLAPNSMWETTDPSESRLETVVKTAVLTEYLRLSGRMFSDADFAEMLEVRAAQIAALKLPPKERFAEFARLKNRVASEGRPTFTSQFAGAAFDLSSALGPDAEVLAKLQVSRVALEIERWRLAHGGRAPDSPEDLVPEFAPSLPLDPFDHNPLRYRRLARGFVVYSIGADFSDDGGKEKPGGASDTSHYDITFSVER